MFANGGFRGGFARPAFRPGLGFGRFGGFGSNRFGWRGRFGGFGCWDCGFGFGWGGFGWGLGWGWGWGGWGLGFGWNPWWYDPFWNPYWYGWGWPGYGYYDAYPPAPPEGSITYPPPYGDNNTDSNDSDQYQNDSTAQGDVQPEYDSQASQQPWENPNPNTGNVAESAPTVLLYMKDGSTVPATDYWVSGGMLHYRITYGGEESINMRQLDLQRTVDENAKRGVRFTLKPEPVPPAPAPAPATTAATSTT